MGTGEENQRDQIWKMVLENVPLFCAPRPEGLGFPRPGMIPDHYMKHPDQWPLDKRWVQELKRAQQLREGIAGRTVSTGMAPDTRQLLDDIRQLDQEGLAPKDIASRLDVAEAGVRNVLALGREAGNPEAQGPHRLPQMEAFRKRWGRDWPRPGGNGNGNGNH